MKMMTPNVANSINRTLFWLAMLLVGLPGPDRR